MKFRVFKRVFCSILFTFVLFTNVFPQLTLGPRRLVSAPAPTLQDPTRLRTRTGTPRPLRLGFLGRVGGVTFDGVAKPKGNLTVRSLNLDYTSRNKADGERLSILINGKNVSAPIPDWKLIPIAKFANSDFYSTFTLFGRLEDREEEKRIIESGGNIVNYHPAFMNTLMGLRLFQLDTLALSRFASYDLVKDADNYLLGKGESEPNIETNRTGLNRFLEFRSENLSQFNKGSSYLISDRDTDVFFSIEGNNLSLSGEPTYYYWDIDREFASNIYEPEKIQVEHKLISEQLDWMSIHRPRATRKSWFIKHIIIGINQYAEKIEIPRYLRAYSKHLENVLLMKTKRERETYLKEIDLGPLSGELTKIRLVNKYLRAKEASELNNLLSNQTEMFRAINPTVWNSGVTVMQYAAFFRYYKNINPIGWRNFMRQIESVEPRPFVETPTKIPGLRQENQ